MTSLSNPRMSLWQIEDDLTALLDSIDTCPDELKPEIQAEIDAYIGQEVTKVDQIAHVLAALDYEQKAAADEIVRLQERKKAAKNAQDRLEQYVCRVIKMRGVKRLEGKTNTLSVRPSDAVVIKNAQGLPLWCQSVTVTIPAEAWACVLPSIVEHVGEVIPTWTPDKAAIKKVLKAGTEVPGADLEFRDNLQRK